jgi:hypothetical protein
MDLAIGTLLNFKVQNYQCLVVKVVLILKALQEI